MSFHSLEDAQPVSLPFWNRHTLRQCFCFILGILFLVYSTLTPKNLNHGPSSSRATISVSKHHSTAERGALVDRGANGGIAGNDVKILSYTDRVINMTGIDNHQLTDIRIGTVAAHAVSQRGPVILIMHQYAVYQQNRTIHSCVQLEHFKNIVDDRSLKAGGKQRITTHDGYVFPLDIVNGLLCLKMRIPSDTELDTLPHVTLTADMPFEYHIMDCTISDKPDWYDSISNWHEGILDSPFSLTGEYKHLDKEYELNLHLLHDLNYPWDVSSCFDLDANAAIQHLPSKPNYEELRPYFLNVPANVVMHTLDATTQFARHIQSGPEMHKTHRSPFPACNVRRRNEPVATDTVFGDVPAVDTGGMQCAQVFVGRKTLVVDIYGMKTKSQFVNTLLDNIRQCGAMDCLITDHAAEAMSQRVMDVLRHLLIDSWTSEPHQQRQNFAERRWRDVKRIATWLMGYKGVPPDCWLLCLEYVADVMNLTAVESLHWRTPLECLTGQKPDTSILMLFTFYDEVYYSRDAKPSFPSQSPECKGRFVGFTKHVGHALTFNVLSDKTRRVLPRSLIRRCDQKNRLLDPDPPSQYPPVFHSLSDDALPEGSDNLPTLPTLEPIDADALYDQLQDDYEDKLSSPVPSLIEQPRRLPMGSLQWILKMGSLLRTTMGSPLTTMGSLKNEWISHVPCLCHPISMVSDFEPRSSKELKTTTRVSTTNVRRIPRTRS